MELTWVMHAEPLERRSAATPARHDILPQRVKQTRHSEAAGRRYETCRSAQPGASTVRSVCLMRLFGVPSRARFAQLQQQMPHWFRGLISIIVRRLDGPPCAVHATAYLATVGSRPVGVEDET